MCPILNIRVIPSITQINSVSWTGKDMIILVRKDARKVIKVPFPPMARIKLHMFQLLILTICTTGDAYDLSQG